MKKTTVAVLIGRFQPFHLAHLQLVEAALAKADRLLILLGSHRCAPDIRNPWSSEERQEMISSVLSKEQLERVTFVPLRDHLYSDNLWLTEVQQKVQAHSEEGDRILLVGRKKQHSGTDLELFPQWDWLEVPVEHEIHSATIRDAFFSTQGPEVWGVDLPAGVHFFLETYRHGEGFAWLQQEAEYLRSYRQQWAVAPYPPTFVTVDAVVVQSGHVLVVRRRVRPGQGLIALPGGYLAQEETVVEGMLRELREETGLKVPKPVLEGSIAGSRVFDAPGRSLRGRVITHAFLMQLKPGPLPAVRGASDAEKAFWMPLAEIYGHEERFFEDHVQIIQSFISRV